ncbi:MAG: hypothetical protein JSU09_03150 [Bacteroidetes bacterium]|nr:hypothetical protein [Bacteroidota bacterium]
MCDDLLATHEMLFVPLIDLNSFEMKYWVVTSILFLSGCRYQTSQTDNRSSYIRELAKIVGIQQVPFKYDLAKHNPDIRRSINKHSPDTLFFDDFNGSIGGLLPDTSNFFGFIYYKVGDSHYPFLLTVDKKGKIIDRQSIGLGHCGGQVVDIESCTDSVSINEKLEIEMLYEMRGKVEINDSIPKEIKICNWISGKGKVTKEGRIEVTKGKLEVCD